MTPDDTVPSSDQLDIIMAALETVTDPCSAATGIPLSLREMGLIKSIDIGAVDIRIVLRLTSPGCMQIGAIVHAIDVALERCNCTRAAIVTIDSEFDWAPEMIDFGARSRMRALRPVGVAEPA